MRGQASERVLKIPANKVNFRRAADQVSLQKGSLLRSSSDQNSISAKTPSASCKTGRQQKPLQTVVREKGACPQPRALPEPVCDEAYPRQAIARKVSSFASSAKYAVLEDTASLERRTMDTDKKQSNQTG